MLFIWFRFAASYLVRVPLFNARQLALLATSAISRPRNPRLSAFAKRACTVEQGNHFMCLNRLDICMLHDQVIRGKVEAAKNHDSKVVLLWKKSSTCQWFRLLTVCCQRFTHQPIVFLRCEANAYFIGSGCAGSLSLFFSGCRPRFSRLAASPLDALSRTWLTEEKRETARSLGVTETGLPNEKGYKNEVSMII